MLFCILVDCETIGFEEAVQSIKWQEVIDEEMTAILKIDTWTLGALSKGQKAIEVKWVCKAKKNAKEKLKEIKQGRRKRQSSNIDYEEDLLMLLPWKIHQIDAKSTFLFGILKKSLQWTTT